MSARIEGRPAVPSGFASENFVLGRKPYSITSSARARSVGGTSRPSATPVSNSEGAALATRPNRATFILNTAGSS